MAFENVTVDDGEVVLLTYSIVNSGHSDPNEVEKELQQAVGTLADKAAQAAATAAGGLIGIELGGAIGTAVVPLIGSALGALAGWLLSEVGVLLWVNCDGGVAAAVHMFTGAQLREQTAGNRILSELDNHQGTASPSGCGSNSNYDVTWSIYLTLSTIVETVGSGIAGDPAAVSWAPGRLDIFARGTGGELLHKFFEGGWGPGGLGGPLEVCGPGIAGDPAAVSWAPGRLDIFARGTGGELLHKFFEGGWGPGGLGGPLEVVGSGIASDPVAVSWAPGRLDIFALADNGDILHKFFEGGWGPNGMGGPLELVGTGHTTIGIPTAVSWGSKRLDVFVRANDGGLLHKFYDKRWGP
jgi:hypothetical protein